MYKVGQYSDHCMPQRVWKGITTNKALNNKALIVISRRLCSLRTITTFLATGEQQIDTQDFWQEPSGQLFELTSINVTSAGGGAGGGSGSGGGVWQCFNTVLQPSPNLDWTIGDEFYKYSESSG